MNLQVFATVAAFALSVPSVGFAQPVILVPTRSFDIRKSLPDKYRTDAIYVHQFVARASGLYYLIAPGPSAGAPGTFLLHTDSTGGFRTAIPLRGIVPAFDVGADGKIYVARAGKATGRGVDVYDAQANFVETRPLTKVLKAFCVVDGTPVVASHDGSVHSLAQGADKPVMQAGQAIKFYMAALPDRKFILVDGIAARFYLGDLTGGPQKTITPDTPEIASARKAYAVPEHGVIFHSFAAAPNGGIYLAVSGHRLTDGVPILHFDDTGNLVRSIRCLLPGSAKGTMLPSHVGVTDELLYVVSGPAGVTAVYRP